MPGQRLKPPTLRTRGRMRGPGSHSTQATGTVPSMFPARGCPQAGIVCPVVTQRVFYPGLACPSAPETCAEG